MYVILKFTKYQLSFVKFALPIWYLSSMVTPLLPKLTGGQIATTGGSTLVLFILCVMLFQTSFSFSQANNISRRSFFYSTLLSLVSLAGMVTVIDALFVKIINDTFSFFYPPSIAKFPWNFAFALLVGGLGWMITLMYYRSNTVTKVMISLIPVVTPIVWFFWLKEETRGFLQTLFAKAMGFGGSVPNPYPGILTLLLLSACVSSITALLMYKITVKV